MLTNMLKKVYNKVKQRGLKDTSLFAYKRVQNILYKLLNNSKHKEELHAILRIYTNQKVIILPPLVDWNIPLFQRPQHLAKNMAKYNILYFYTTSSKLYDHVNGFEQIAENCYLTNRFDLVDNITERNTV